jgi:LysR family hydrogen peroxide-inducible transcriptional activator
MRDAPHPFTLRQLQYVVAVAEELNFRRAAERCHVSQPSLSAQLAQVEEMLGVVLFERDRRRVLPTAAGAELVTRARALLRQADDLLLAAQVARNPLEGLLRIGVIPTVSPYLLPRVAPGLRGRFPRLSVAWVEEKTPELGALLERGELDAAIVALEAPLGELDHVVIAHDPFVLAAPKGHPLVRGRAPLQRAELAEAEVLVLEDGHCFREQALAVCASSRAQALAFRATSLTTLAQMVAGGFGVTLLPELAVETEGQRADLAFRHLAAPVPSRTLALAWRRGSALGPALREVATALKETAESRA